jgi:hypothetical protein
LPISASAAVDPAFVHTKQQLLRPFRLGQWLRLAVVGILAGEAGSSGGCNFNYPLNTPHQGSRNFLGAGWPAAMGDHPLILFALVAALIVIGIGLVVLFTYIASVMRFILFDSIIARECHIRRGWSRRKDIGARLFVFQLWLMLATLAGFLVVIGIPAGCAAALGWFQHPGDHVLGLVLAGIVWLFIFLALVIVVAVIDVMTKDFVVPQMALEGVSAMDGWRRLWLWLKFDKAGYAGYIGMKIVLAIAAAILVTIAIFVAVLVLLLPIGGVGVAIAMAAKTAGWTWNLYSITLAVIAGCVVFAILMFVILLLSAPAIVFFPAYSIYFFAPRYAQLAALLWPQPATPPAPPAPA